MVPIDGLLIEGKDFLKDTFRNDFGDNLKIKFRMLKNLCTGLCISVSCAWVYGLGTAT